MKIFQRIFRKYYLIIIGGYILINVVSATAAANNLNVNDMSFITLFTDPNDFKPVECTMILVEFGPGNGNGLILGTAGDDNINGGAGDDCIFGGEGDDKLSGGLGDDVILGHDGNDILNGGQGTDICYGGNGTDTHKTQGPNPTCETLNSVEN